MTVREEDMFFGEVSHFAYQEESKSTSYSGIYGREQTPGRTAIFFWGKEEKTMKNTAIGANGKSNSANDLPNNIVKVRLMGTEDDIKKYSERLEQFTSNSVEWNISSKSRVFDNKDTKKYKRMYLDVTKKNMEDK